MKAKSILLTAIAAASLSLAGCCVSSQGFSVGLGGTCPGHQTRSFGCQSGCYQGCAPAYGCNPGTEYATPAPAPAIQTAPRQ